MPRIYVIIGLLVMGWLVVGLFAWLLWIALA